MFVALAVALLLALWCAGGCLAEGGMEGSLAVLDGGLNLQSGDPEGDPASDFTYEIADGEVTITGYSGDGGEVIIPAWIDGSPVTVIGDSAFFSKQSLTKVYIPSTVRDIEDFAFAGSSLTSFRAPADLYVDLSSQAWTELK